MKGVLLIGALLTLLVLASGCAQKPAQPPTESILSAFASYTDLRIGSVQQTLEIIASTNEVKSGNWDAMKDLLAGYQASDGGLVVWYARPDGAYYTVDKGLMDVTLSDRSYFPELMAGRKVVGALVVSKSTGQRSAVIAIPVKRGETVAGAVGASLFLDKLSEQVNAGLALGPDMSYFALAPDGLTALHRQADRQFLDPRELGSASLKAAVEEMLAGTAGSVTYEFDNATKTAVYRTSPLTQWRFAIATSGAVRQ